MSRPRELIKKLLGARIRNALKKNLLHLIAPEHKTNRPDISEDWTRSPLTPRAEGCAHTDVEEICTAPRHVLQCRECRIRFPKEKDAFDDAQSEFWNEDTFLSMYSLDKGKYYAYWAFLICRTLMMHGCGFYNHEPPNKRVLDVGCGAGFFLHLLRGYYHYDTWGLEPSEWGRRFAREEFGLDRIINATSPDKTNLPNEHFGLLILNHTLEHVPEPFELLKDMYRVGAPGALLYGEVPDGDLRDNWHRPEDRWFFSEQSLDFYLRSAGFEPLSIFAGRNLT